MVQETFPPERPFGRSEDEHDEVDGYGPLGAGEVDAAARPIGEPPRPQPPADSAGGPDVAA